MALWHGLDWLGLTECGSWGHIPLRAWLLGPHSVKLTLQMLAAQPSLGTAWRGGGGGIPFRMDFRRIRETQGPPLCFAIFMNCCHVRSRIQTGSTLNVTLCKLPGIVQIHPECDPGGGGGVGLGRDPISDEFRTNLRNTRSPLVFCDFHEF